MPAARRAGQTESEGLMIRLRKPEQIGDAISFARELAGLSQRDLAALTGFKQSQISAWELGVGRPNLASTMRLFKALGWGVALTPDRRTVA